MAGSVVWMSCKVVVFSIRFNLSPYPPVYRSIFISDDLVRKVWGEKCLDVLSCKVVVFSTRLNLSPHPSAHNVWDTCEGLRSEEPVWKKSSRKSWRECAGCWWPAQLVGRYAQVEVEVEKK